MLTALLAHHCTHRGAALDGTVVRALASHLCGPGSIPRLNVICRLSLLLVLVLALRGFSLGSPGFLSPHIVTFPNLNSIGNLRVTGLSVQQTVECHPR